MPRQRMIRPYMPQDDGFGSCSYIARLIFIHMLCRADDWGWFQDRPKQIKGWCFPYDSITEDEIIDALSQLVEHKLLEYWYDEKERLGYFHYRTWDRHQNIEKKFESMRCVKDIHALTNHSVYPISIVYQSDTDSRPIADQSDINTDKKRKEEKRIEEKRSTPYRTTSNSTSTTCDVRTREDRRPIADQSLTSSRPISNRSKSDKIVLAPDDLAMLQQAQRNLEHKRASSSVVPVGSILQQAAEVPATPPPPARRHPVSDTDQVLCELKPPNPDHVKTPLSAALPDTIENVIRCLDEAEFWWRDGTPQTCRDLDERRKRALAEKWLQTYGERLRVVETILECSTWCLEHPEKSAKSSGTAARRIGTWLRKEATDG